VWGVFATDPPSWSLAYQDRVCTGDTVWVALPVTDPQAAADALDAARKVLREIDDSAPPGALDSVWLPVPPRGAS
jgi:hypothetical protein